jgi:hypothetical protein
MHLRFLQMKKLLLLCALCAANIDIASAALDTAKIDELTGLKGKWNEKEGVYKVTFSREDVKVAVGGWTMPPFMGLGTWAAFTPGVHSDAMVMGDTVLFEDEVNAAMTAAIDNGLNVTALHNHFFFDQPKVFFMHIEGEGNLDDLARAVKKMYDTTKAIRGSSGASIATEQAKLPEKNSITVAPLNEILGTQGESKEGVVKFTIGRPAMMHGVKIEKDMGVNTWAAFAGSDDNAVVDGDFAVTEDELQPVLKSLLKNKINIVAIHSHMTHEQPRIIFFHYWGRGLAKSLAEAIKDGILISGLQKVSSPVSK